MLLNLDLCAFWELRKHGFLDLFGSKVCKVLGFLRRVVSNDCAITPPAHGPHLQDGHPKDSTFFERAFPVLEVNKIERRTTKALLNVW